MKLKSPKPTKQQHSKSVITRGGIPWDNPKDVSTLLRVYPLEGWEGCVKAMPWRNKGNIINKASKLGLLKPRLGRKPQEFDLSALGPQRYRPEFEPLKPQPLQPMRENAYDFAKLPSWR
jgi:hypothetical protein